MEFEVLGMQRWDKPTNRAQREDQKNGVKMQQKELKKSS